MRKDLPTASEAIKLIFGCAAFGLGFNIFLQPNGLNAGGISGLSMIAVRLLRFGSVGLFTALVNLPLFWLAKARVGKRFFLISLIGMVLSAVSIDVFSAISVSVPDPLIAALYGGALCGLGLGVVFLTGGSTGGSDIIVRLLKQKHPNTPIGMISSVFDFAVALLTGIALRNISSMLYSGVAIFVAGRVIDAVVYRFDYSKVALIISKHHDAVAQAINGTLSRGVTLLYGEGGYSHGQTKVILTAVKRQQLAELKELVTAIDKDAFMIVQEAHQVLGDGFSHYSADSL